MGLDRRGHSSYTQHRSGALRGGGEKDSAQIAQLVEHTTENCGVGGSNPPLGTIFPP